ncbi:winged helix-turn-helix domain-containing protein [Roseibium sp. MMSF_3412]|uniref:winged helix-turn-helix domain-containing protein n=1 Tax=Roseibium sp. MMSF_3412 TaxID=3046712 RepID=UPI0027400929|nr:winged helix-turn-helix domain-containing protein [Roseibium sp. MMSF_3412]
MERKLITIVAMDVVGYSRMMERDEERTLRRLNEIRAGVVEPSVARHSGRTVKTMGDGALLEFSSVVSALQCAIEIQKDLAEKSTGPGGQSQLHYRIGIHLGDVIAEGEDIYGDGVNVAARLESLAQPGGIVLSKQVFDHIGGRVQAEFTPLGEQRVKNISRPIEAYSVDLSDRQTPPGTLRFGAYELDPDRFELRCNGTPVAVEPQVFDLVSYLARNSERTVTKEEIFSRLWGERFVSDSALSSQIKMARKVLGDDGTAQHTIRTIHGRGFRFVAELKQPQENPAQTGVQVAEAVTYKMATMKPSVAILPFINLNTEPSEDYLADGITEDITTALSKNRWLTVIARNSTFSFRNSADGIRVIGEKLGASYIVTGSVRKAGQRVRITVQLVDAGTENSVWSERFDRDMKDIFDLQDEITELVASRIESELGMTEQRKAERRPRKNLGAWDLYQLGVAEFYKFTPEANMRCQDLLRQSLQLDPDFASAHSRLAYAIVLSMVYFDAAPDDDRMDEALIAAKRALELDDQDANSFFTIGRVYLARREYDLAIDALEHAVELNPYLAVTYCGLGDSLAYEGRLDEAIEQFEIAIRLSPHDPFRWAFYSYRSLAHLFRGEYEDAVSWARKSVQIPNAQYWAKAHLVAALGLLGETDQATRAIRDLTRLKPEFSIDFAREHLFYLKKEDQIETYMEGLRKAGLREHS